MPRDAGVADASRYMILRFDAADAKECSVAIWRNFFFF